MTDDAMRALIWRVAPDEDGEGGETWRAAYADLSMTCLSEHAALSAPAELDVETLANRLAERTLLLQKALDDPSKPFIENWRTVARVLLDQPLARSQEPTP